MHTCFPFPAPGTSSCTRPALARPPPPAAPACPQTPSSSADSLGQRSAKRHPNLYRLSYYRDQDCPEGFYPEIQLNFPTPEHIEETID